ncbi:MAG: hypothetical protein RIR26_1881 [Pseudomonadota bacterium]
MVSQDDLTIPDEFLRLAYLAVLAERSLEVNSFLDALVELPTLRSQDEHQVFASRAAAPPCPDAHTIREYLKNTTDKLHLLALPFLTEEVRQELHDLQLWSDSRGAKTFNEFFSQSSLPDDLRTESLREAADFHFIVFVEWMTDVQFIAATPDERRSFLPEFPFEKMRGGKK